MMRHEEKDCQKGGNEIIRNGKFLYWAGAIEEKSEPY